MPEITVGMPVYNGEQFVEESIKSVLAQTFDDFELLISDNCSTDRTAEICRDYAARDRRIRYWCNERNLGAAGNYNILHQQAAAPFFRWSNADDLLDPTLHQECINALKDNSNAVLAAGMTVFIDETGQVGDNFDDDLHLVEETPADRFRNFLSRVSLTNIIYGLMRTKALGRTDLMGDGSIPAADTIMMGQLVMQGYFLQISKPLFFRRLHGRSSSANRDDNERQQSFWSAGSTTFKKPCCRRHIAYLRGVSNTSVGFTKVLPLYGVIAGQLWANKREIAKEILSLSKGKK